MPLLEAYLAELRDIRSTSAALWRNVPANVWEYTLGGYQVLKKWLSYRERELLGRDLTPDEAHYFRDVCRRIAAIVLLGPALDANYQAVKGDAYEWPAAGAQGTARGGEASQRPEAPSARGAEGEGSA